MISGKDVPGLGKFNVRHLVLSVIFFALMPCSIAICTASDETDVGWAAVENVELDESRAGFVLDNGIVIDLSFATSVFVNGREQFSDRLVLAKDFSLDQLSRPAVNNGSGNLALSDAGLNNMAVIQNTLDNQLITMVRTIDITLSNFKNMNLSAMGPNGRWFAY